MSLAEIKHSIEKCSVDERLELAALIAHLNHDQDPEYARELNARMESMDRGEKMYQADLEDIHRKLSRRGK
jgi:hypothetical protein